MAILSRDQILKASDLKTETVKVPEWHKNGEVIVGTMTGTARDEFETSLFNKKGKDTETNLINMRSKLLVMCIVDKDGKRLFTEHDINRLGAKSAKPLDRLFTIAQRLNGIGAEDVDDLIKN